MHQMVTRHWHHQLQDQILSIHFLKYVKVALTRNGASSPGGSGGTQTIDVGHKPDLIWIKDRGQAGHNNNLIDSVNGALIFGCQIILHL